jgi:hypothetical protein
MKNYKVKAIKKFNDKETNIKRDIGDEFEVTKERYEVLKLNGAVELVEIKETIKIVEKKTKSIKTEETKVEDLSVDPYKDFEIKGETPKPKKKKSSKK